MAHIPENVNPMIRPCQCKSLTHLPDFCSLGAITGPDARTSTPSPHQVAPPDVRRTADVFIDGALDATIDLYSGRQVFEHIVSSRTGLTNGDHTIKVVVRSDGNPNSSGDLVTVDASEPVSDRIECESMCLFGGARVGPDTNASRRLYVSPR